MSTDGNTAPVCPDVDADMCDWMYDAGDASTGVNAAWVCQKCGAYDDQRDPPEDF